MTPSTSCSSYATERESSPQGQRRSSYLRLCSSRLRFNRSSNATDLPTFVASSREDKSVNRASCSPPFEVSERRPADNQRTLTLFL